MTVYSANVEVPMKWRIGSPSRDRRTVPSGRWPLFCSSRMARQRFGPRAAAVDALAALGREQRHDVIAGRDGRDALADGLDDPRALVAQDGRRVARRVAPRGGVDVGVAHAAGDEPDQHLAGLRLGQIDLRHDERLAELLEHRGAHPHGRCTLRARRRRHRHAESATMSPFAPVPKAPTHAEDPSRPAPARPRRLPRVGRRLRRRRPAQRRRQVRPAGRGRALEAPGGRGGQGRPGREGGARRGRGRPRDEAEDRQADGRSRRRSSSRRTSSSARARRPRAATRSRSSTSATPSRTTRSSTPPGRATSRATRSSSSSGPATSSRAGTRAWSA
jgi:hypothetical protein